MLSLVIASLVLAAPQDDPWEKLFNLATIIGGGTKAERLVGELGQDDLTQRFSKEDGSNLYLRIRKVFDKLVDTGEKRKDFSYQLTMLQNYEINAYDLRGGQVLINDGLADLRGISDDEIGFVLAHELTHTNRSHGFKQLRDSLIGSVVLSSISDRKARFVAAIASQLFSSGHSRRDEEQADREGFELAVKAGFDPSGGLALMRRLETTAHDNPGLLHQLFATHQPTVARSLLLKDKMFEKLYGSSYRDVLVSGVTLGELQKFDPDKEKAAWQAAYKKATGWDVFNLKNVFPERNCTWFVQAVRPESIPLVPITATSDSNAHHWYANCKNAGYGVGSTPKVGAIMVWGKEVSGYGHVALLTEHVTGTVWKLWDCNWSLNLDGLIREREIDIAKTDHVTGYVYWPNGATVAPKGYPGYVEGPTGPVTIKLLEKTVRLGDDEAGIKTVWAAEFKLTAEQLAEKKTAVITLKVRAVPRKDPIVSFNRHEVGRAGATSDKWEQFRFEV